MTTIPFLDESRLVDLIHNPAAVGRSWHDGAACAGLRPDPYFPDDDNTPSAEAIARCAQCVVAAHCLATALISEAESGLRFGWWGGLGPTDRDEIACRIGIATQPSVESERPHELARRLREQRHTIPSIAAELGCTERTVYRYLAATAA